MNRSILAAASLVAGFLANALQASPYQVQFESNVSYIQGTGWDASVFIGAKLSATFNLDSASPNWSFDPTLGGYVMPGLASTMDLGSYHFAGNFQNLLGIFDNNALFGEGYALDSYVTNPAAPLYSGLSVRLWSSDFSILSNTAQPVQALDLSLFPGSGTIMYDGFKDNSGAPDAIFRVYGQITSFKVIELPSSPVPDSLPATTVLAVTCAGLAFIKRRFSV